MTDNNPELDHAIKLHLLEASYTSLEARHNELASLFETVFKKMDVTFRNLIDAVEELKKHDNIHTEQIGKIVDILGNMNGFKIGE